MPTARAVARWIEAVSWGFVLLGFLLPAAVHTVLFRPWLEAALRWAYGAATLPSGDEKLLGLMLGITGGSIAGKWIVHALIARGPLAEGEAWARDLTLRGLAAWFFIDSLVSLWLGAAFNVAMINLMPLLLVGVPLMATWSAWGRTPPLQEQQSPLARVCFWAAVFGASTGIGIAFGGGSPLFAMWWTGLEASQYAGAALGEGSRRLALLFFGPIGGCTVAQFLMLAGLIRRDGPTRRAALAGAASIAGWFAVDSGYGLANGGFFNIVQVNLPGVAVTLPPWLLLWTRARKASD